jgi:hypothetical protein
MNGYRAKQIRADLKKLLGRAPNKSELRAAKKYYKRLRIAYNPVKPS